MKDHPSRLDAWLPNPDVSEQHTISINADKQRIYTALRSKPLRFRGLSRALMAMRWLGESLTSLFSVEKKQRVAKPGAISFVDRATSLGFVILEEVSEDELVLGFAGRFWTLVPEILDLRAEEFLAFHQPGYAKAIVNFKIIAIDHQHCLLSTETRVKGCDNKATRRLKCYWSLIKPFSGFIRRDALRAISHTAVENGDTSFLSTTG